MAESPCQRSPGIHMEWPRWAKNRACGGLRVQSSPVVDVQVDTERLRLLVDERCTFLEEQPAPRPFTQHPETPSKT